MIRNFFIVAFRNLLKQKLFAAFNVLGIAMGIACCLVVYLTIRHQLSQDSFHANAPAVFAVNHVRTINGQPELWGTSPDAVGPALKAALPQVKRFVRFHGTNAVVKSGGNVFHEYVRLADPDFFRMFTFPLANGSADPLADPNGLVLSDAAARKYFGKNEAVGRSLTLLFDGNVRRTFVVRAVAAPFSHLASFSFDVLVGYGAGKGLGWRENDWKRSVQVTFVQVGKPGDEIRVAAALGRMLKLHNAVNAQAPIASFYLDNLRDVSRHSYKTRHSVSGGTSPEGMVVLGVLAGLVLFMACFNFMNYSIATSTTRFKEIGVRKTLGSTRQQLIRQFIGENLLVGLVALVVGLVLTQTVFLPTFSRAVDFFQLRFDVFQDWQPVLFLILLLFGIGLLSGLYPSVYISRFDPVAVLKGKQRIGGATGLGRTLLVVQFGLSMFTVAVAILAAQNAEFLRHMDVGYQPADLVVLRADSEQSFRLLRDAARRLPEVTAVAGSQDQIGGTGDNPTTLEDGPTKSTAEVLRVSAEYLQTLNFRLREGRSFRPESTTDAESAVLVNQSLVKAMGWTSAVGKRVRVQGTMHEVVGVIEDFNYRFFFLKIAPCVLKLNLPAANRVLTLKVTDPDLDRLTARLKPAWRQAMPDVPFQLSRQTDVYTLSYDESRRVKDICTYVALLTLVISAMGLFALVSLNIAKKTKEIGIRKVLGASAFGIANLLNREFFSLILVAGALFLPLAFVAVKALFDNVYAYHTPITATAFVATLVLMFVLALLTIGSQVYKIALSNPVKALRTE